MDPLNAVTEIIRQSKMMGKCLVAVFLRNFLRDTIVGMFLLIDIVSSVSCCLVNISQVS